MADITYRQFERKDEEGVLSLFQASFGVPRDRQEWSWEFLSGPDKSIIVVAESDGKIVGHYAVLPRRMRLGKEVVKAGLVVDVMTHPQYGRRGIFSSSALKAFELCKEEGISILMGFPNDAAIRGHRKVGWAELGHVRVFVRPLTSSVFQKALHVGSKKRVVCGKVIDRLVTAGIRSDSAEEVDGIRLACASKDEFLALHEEVRQFLDEVLPRSAMCNAAENEWLRWRLSDPAGAHFVFTARDAKTRSIVGALILKVKQYKGMRAGGILDIAVRRDRPSVRGVLLKKAIAKSVQEKCEVCVMLGGPATRDIVGLLGHGLLPSPKKLRFIARTTDGSPLPDRLADMGSWHLQLIDHDVI